MIVLKDVLSPLELDEFLTKTSGIKMKRPLEIWDY